MQAYNFVAILTVLGVAPAALAQDAPTPNTNLPSDAGQVWREYDIRPYVQRVQGIDEPQQTIINWILRDTGTDTWFREPFGLLHANKESIRVYHTEKVQALVAEIVERFVRPKDAGTNGVSVHLVTVSSPNWRSLAIPVMRPVPIRTAGVDAWLINKEHATVLFSQLKARPDFREHSSAAFTVLNGQSHTISRTVPRTFAKSVSLAPDGRSGFQTQMGEIKEGFKLTLSPLATLDGSNMDVIVQCQVEQIESMSSISVELPPPARGRVPIQVPQVTSWQIHERFRWPAQDVLLISRTVMAMPGEKRPGLDNLPAMLASGRPRADAILLLDARSAVGARPPENTTDRRASRLNYHGRY